MSETIPGIYWMTYFGPRLVDRIGEAQLRSIPIGRGQSFGTGFVVTAYDNPKLIGSVDALARERAIIRHLGGHSFFKGNDKSERRAGYGSRLQLYAEQNRKKPTKAHARLLRILDRLDGGRFRGRFDAEHPCNGGWILDLYSWELQLGFEVDGGYHNRPKQKERDRLKERDCAEAGITLVRFTNAEIMHTDTKLLEAKIRQVIHEAIARNDSLHK